MRLIRHFLWEFCFSCYFGGEFFAYFHFLSLCVEKSFSCVDQCLLESVCERESNNNEVINVKK